MRAHVRVCAGVRVCLQTQMCLDAGACACVCACACAGLRLRVSACACVCLLLPARVPALDCDRFHLIGHVAVFVDPPAKVARPGVVAGPAGQQGEGDPSERPLFEEAVHHRDHPK